MRSTGAEARRTGVGFNSEPTGSDRRGCRYGNRIFCVFLISGDSTAAGVDAVTEAGNNHPNQMAKMLWKETKKTETQLRLGSSKDSEA